MDVPIPNSYWVLPGRLLAGEYPVAADPQETLARLRRILGAGMSVFVDLMELDEHGLPPYTPLLRRAAGEAPAEHLRRPLPDAAAPQPEEMRAVLDAVDAALAAGQGVYLHCHGGIGRTGTAVGCWLVRHGRSGDEALAELARLRQELPTAGFDSPSTEAQRERVRTWAEWDGP